MLKGFGRESLMNWMGDALIRKADDLLAEQIELDGSVRIAVFDRQRHLIRLYCKGVVKLDKPSDDEGVVYAVDQRVHKVHFAVRDIADYTSNINGFPFRFGANVKMDIRTGDMYSLRPLFESISVQRDALTACDIYCRVQAVVEDRWRKIVRGKCAGGIWQQDACFREMKAIEVELETQTTAAFREQGIHCKEGMRIEGVSEPLWVR